MEDDSYHLTLHGLLRKRGELSSELEALRVRLNVGLAALDHIDAVIRVFKPDIDIGDMPERPAPPPNAAFRGEVQRFLLHTLRTAERPMRTLEFAEAVMRSRGLNVQDRVLAKLIRTRTSHSLSRLRRQGYIEGYRWGKGAELEWRLTDRGEGDEPCGGWRNGTSSETPNHEFRDSPGNSTSMGQ